MLVFSILILKREKYRINSNTWKNRLRFNRLTKNDLKWIFSGIVATGILSVGLMKLIEIIFGKFDVTPSFMAFESLSAGRYWILLIWLPFWILNIMGEEILWRGVMMPRQEISFGRCVWIIQGLGWTLFHITMGYQLVIMLLPLMFIQSFIVYKTKKSWAGVIMHSLFNGPSFVAIAFGLV